VAANRSVVCLAFLIALLGVGARAGAQDNSYVRGMDLESAGKYREAVIAFRQALATPNAVPAMLGLERAYAAIGMTDSIIPVIDSAIRAKPREPVFRTVELRSLHSLGRGVAARQSFERWVRDFPREAAPYREYSRMLIDAGQPHSADSMLMRAQRVLGGARDFQMEIAQTRAALGLWELSAHAWREAVRNAPYLERAAIFALTPTPAATRPAVRASFLAAPIEPTARQILASLEVGWGSPRDAWEALRELVPNDSVAVGWRDFADRAEAAEAWLVARDALTALVDWKMSPELAVRAAEAGLRGGDPASALALATRAASAQDSASAARSVALVRVRALSALGRAADAAQVGEAYNRWLEGGQRDVLRREIAWAWVRAGDVGKARSTLAVAGTEEEAAEVTGWLALYEGDLRTARASLRGGGTTADATMAMALLARTRVATAPEVGRAFLDLARGDSMGAAKAFEQAAGVVTDASSLLLSIAARIRAARGEHGPAVTLWQLITERYAESPEAAEANLDWARALRRAGDSPGAVRRLEHLIITYPQSALLPQARRELDLIRRTIPPLSV
jgi:tetratricopeptide (TPR) repeat protein